jgi:hypothetical protein
MKLVNGWKGPLQWDKLNIGLRVGPLNLVRVVADWSSRQCHITLLNFRVEL